MPKGGKKDLKSTMSIRKSARFVKQSYEVKYLSSRQ